jgi:colanic acid/amylovoran biosynthesis glycosyltransferase
MHRIKTLHLFNKYLPPTQNWLYNLLKHLPDTEIHIGANLYLKNNFYDPAFRYVNHPFGELWEYDKSLKENHWKELPKRLVLKLIRLFLGNAAGAIETYGRREKIDLIHAHFAPVGWQFRNLPSKLNVPFIVSFYGWDYENLPFVQPEYAARYKRLFQRADCFFCEGSHGMEVLKKMGCPENKIKIVPLGVEVEKIPVNEGGKIPDSLRLVQLASFAQKKGHIYSLKAFAKALNDCPNMHLTLVGDERERGVKQEAVTFVNEHKLGNKVTIMDWVASDQMHRFFSNFDVFIHPSCYSPEKDCEGGAPIVLLDAQASGLPIISTWHCDIPQEVIHQKTGLLAPEKDVDAISEAIKEFYRMNESEYRKYSAQAINHVLENFNIRKNAERLRELYDSFMS